MTGIQTRNCPLCKESKTFDCFYSRAGKPGGYCITCSKVVSRDNYRATDPIKSRAQRRQWELGAPEEYKEAKRLKTRTERAAWRAANPEAAREQARAHAMVRRSSVSGMLKNRISAGISASLNKRHAKKKDFKNWEHLVGYSAAELAAHLEGKFVNGMNWDNRSEWHIDHIKPLSSFQFTGPDDPEFKRAWSLDNLQPLWAAENQRKHAKLDWQVPA